MWDFLIQPTSLYAKMVNSYVIFECSLGQNFRCDVMSVRQNAKRKPYGLNLNRQAIFTANPIQNSKVMITLKHNSSSIWFFSATKDLSWTDLGASLDGFSFLKKEIKSVQLVLRSFVKNAKSAILNVEHHSTSAVKNTAD